MTTNALDEVLKHWVNNCCLGNNNDDKNGNEDEDGKSKTVKKTRQELQNDAKTFFKYLTRSTSTQVFSISNNDPTTKKKQKMARQQEKQTQSSQSSSSSKQPMILETKSSHEEALAKLIHALQPAFIGNYNSLGNNASKKHIRTRHRQRVRGLHVIVGALEGCQQGGQTSPGSDITFSNASLQLLGTFLLGHVGPIEDDEGVGTYEYEMDDDEDDDEDAYGQEDYETLTRDIALQGLIVLVQTLATPVFESIKNDIDNDDSNGNDSTEAIQSSMQLRLDFAKTGVLRRIASINSFGLTDPTAGLSALPRSKRAMCFDLLQAATNGIKVNTITTTATKQDYIPSSFLLSDMKEFTKFSSTCLSGESDPRCLQQALELLHSIQLSFCDPYFGSVAKEAAATAATTTDGAASAINFPTEEIFDAVSPYFPIQFTPPPNNIHGITREGLHEALISVLNFTTSSVSSSSAISYVPSMVPFSIDLYLETLLPQTRQEENEYYGSMQGDDNAASPVEKLEAMECLYDLLLFNTGNTNDNANTDIWHQRHKWTVSTIQRLALALKSTHDEASMEVARVSASTDPSASSNSIAKRLADLSRTFCSKVAFSLEQVRGTSSSGNNDDGNNNNNSNNNGTFWNQFMAYSMNVTNSNDGINKNQQLLRTSPSTCKTSIAYIACLVASGGPRTLRSCLSMGLEPLLQFMEEKVSTVKHNTNDNNVMEELDDANVAAAIYGMGAFFSSCRVAMQRAQGQGVQLHPHPLEPYLTRSYEIILFSFETFVGSNSNSMKGNAEQQPSSSSSSVTTQIGTIRAFEALLLATPASAATDASATTTDDAEPAKNLSPMLERIQVCIESMLEKILVPAATSEASPSTGLDETNENRREQQLQQQPYDDGMFEELRTVCGLACGTILGTTKLSERYKTKNTIDNEEISKNKDEQQVRQQRPPRPSSSCYDGSLLSTHEQMRTFCFERMYIPLLESIQQENVATTTTNTAAGQQLVRTQRHDRKALAIASSLSLDGAEAIVSSILKSLVEAIRHDVMDRTCLMYAMTLSCIFDYQTIASPSSSPSSSSSSSSTEPYAIVAYFQYINQYNILQALCQSHPLFYGDKDRNEISVVQASVSNLKLPASNEEKESMEARISNVHEITEHLLCAYEGGSVPKDHLSEILNKVTNLLPPLSDSDNFHLYVLLPVLGAALRNQPNEGGTSVMDKNPPADGKNTVTDSDTPTQEGFSVEELTNSMLSGLVEYCLSYDVHAFARTAAASCIQAAIISAMGNNNKTVKGCPAKVLITDLVNPAIQTSSKDNILAFQNALYLLATLGSAAASRGGQSSATAAMVADFLIRVASWTNPTDTKIELPFSSEGDGNKDISLPRNARLDVFAASCFGSMLSVGGMKPLMKQRLLYTTRQSLKQAYDGVIGVGGGGAAASAATEKSASNTKNATMRTSKGILLVACYVICFTNDLSKVEKNVMSHLSTLAMEGLRYEFNLRPADRKQQQTNQQQQQQQSLNDAQLILTTVLKLISVVPAEMEPFILNIVTGLLRAYAVTDPESEVGCKMLALQGLEGLCNNHHIVSTLRRWEGDSNTNNLKLAVISILSPALNHPSGLLRQAAADVRNAWYLLE